MQILKITNTRDVRFDWCTKMQSVVENTHERLVSNITHHYQHSQKPKARKYQLPIADTVAAIAALTTIKTTFRRCYLWRL